MENAFLLRDHLKRLIADTKINGKWSKI